MKKQLTALLPLLLIVSTSCGRREQDTEEAVQPEEAGAETHRELHLEPGVAEEWGIETGRVTATDISSMVTLPGVLELNQNRTAHVSSVVAGKVAGISADLGSTVRRGQVLLTINSPEFAHAQATYLETSARFNLSRREYDRARSLFEEKAIEEREFLRREAEHEQVAAELGAAESVLHSYGFDHDWMNELKAKYERLWREGGDPDVIADPILAITSPVRGSVIYRDVIVGEHVDTPKILFTVSDLGTLWAQLDAYETDLAGITGRSEVEINSSLYPTTRFPGRITYVSDVVDETLRTVKIRVEITNTDGLLKPNMFVQGLVLTRNPSHSSLMVPEEAVQQMEGEKIVFVLEDEGEAGTEHEEEHLVFAVRHVEPGERIGDMRIVLTGLEEGETIVVRGAFTLKAELAKGSVGHAHVH